MSVPGTDVDVTGAGTGLNLAGQSDVTSWSLVFLGIIAGSVLLSSALQVGALLGLRRALRKAEQRLDGIEGTAVRVLQTAEAVAAGVMTGISRMVRHAESRLPTPPPRQTAVLEQKKPEPLSGATKEAISEAVSQGPEAAASALSPRVFLSLLKKAVAAWNADYAPSMGAALSFYSLFSLAPLLLITIAVAGTVFGEEAARGQVVGTLSGLIGQDGASAVEELVKSAHKPSTSFIASVVSLLTLTIGATSVFAELQSALDRIWRAPAQAQRSGIMALLRGRLLSFGLVVSIGFLLLVSLMFSAALEALGSYGSRLLPGWEVVLQWLNTVVSFVITGAMFAAVYRVLPSVRIAWRDVWTGAWMTALLFTIGKSAISLYLGKAAVTSAFGAAGSLVVLLIWVYYSAQVFLLGAEFTWVYAQLDAGHALFRRPRHAD